MIKLLIISFMFLLNVNLPNVEAQVSQSGYYDKIMKNKNIAANSSNLIRSFQSGKKIRCIQACNLNISCNIVIYNSKSLLCSIYKREALNELIEADLGEKTTVYQTKMSFEGLINYWPIVNDLQDYISTSDLSPGQLNASEIVGFTQDRFNNTNGSIFMNPGYYTLPPGIYFGSKYSFLVWVKAIAFNNYSRVIDCGNGVSSDNVVVILSSGATQIPYTKIFRGSAGQTTVMATNTLPINTWFHLATVYDGQRLMMYVNGNVVANSTSAGPLIVNRTNCYIGRSNWYSSGNNPDASACFDNMMLFDRALTTNEIQNCMNYYFNK